MDFVTSFFFFTFLHQVFLIKHCGNRRINDPELFLDFEETYVLDASTKSITRAKVSVSSSINFSCSIVDIVLIT